MSHTDPLFAIPAGLIFTVASLYAAMKPQTVLELHGAGLPQLLRDRGAVIVLRLSAFVTAGVTGWLVVHASRSLLGGCGMAPALSVTTSVAYRDRTPPPADRGQRGTGRTVGQRIDPATYLSVEMAQI